MPDIVQHVGVAFDLFRLSRAKESVGLCEDTLREWHEADGLPFYRRGKGKRKMVFVSKQDVAAVIRDAKYFKKRKPTETKEAV